MPLPTLEDDHVTYLHKLYEDSESTPHYRSSPCCCSEDIGLLACDVDQILLHQGNVIHPLMETTRRCSSNSETTRPGSSKPNGAEFDPQLVMESPTILSPSLSSFLGHIQPSLPRVSHGFC
ncbi:hypothetical protein VNO77_22684 [Canavalia gladiata]|uniref:Uncharacterized protein n=1 Tax=Canavalia gladiata TaxID=3824 RepID=A0AAN9L377_CANGL